MREELLMNVTDNGVYAEIMETVIIANAGRLPAVAGKERSGGRLLALIYRLQL